MTENETKQKLDSLHYKILHTSFCNKVYESEIKALCMAKDTLSEIQQYRAIGTLEEVRMLKDYKELYDVYKLIGTIEEFRNLKYKKNVLPIATIEFNKEDIQKIVDEKVAQIELNIQEIRAKAIDELLEKQLETLEDFKEWEDSYGYPIHSMSETQRISKCKELIKQVAEQMKVGEK